MYLSGDPRWEQMWVVRIDDGKGTLEQHDLPKYEMVSGYKIGIPILHWLVTPAMWGRLFRPPQKIAELPHPIEFYPGDKVAYRNDPERCEREVMHFSFEYDGTLRYAVSETEGEWQEAEQRSIEEARKTKRARIVRMSPMTKQSDAKGEDLVLISRGNHYYVAEGEPSDLSFAHVTLEVEFWKGLGLWLNDTQHSGRHTKLSLEEARARLNAGTIDTVHTGRELEYYPIRLPERFAKFRERSRTASLDYLERFAGRYSFDVLPKNDDRKGPVREF